MIMLPLAKVSFLWTVVMAVWVLIAIGLILVVLIQKGRGGGLASAFGGGAANSLLGTKTGDFLTWVTIGLVALFLVVGVLMGKFMRPTTSTTPLGDSIKTETDAAAQTAADAAAQTAEQAAGTTEAAAEATAEKAAETVEQAADAAKQAETPAPAAPQAPAQQ